MHVLFKIFVTDKFLPQKLNHSKKEIIYLLHLFGQRGAERGPSTVPEFLLSLKKNVGRRGAEVDGGGLWPPPLRKGALGPPRRGAFGPSQREAFIPPPSGAQIPSLRPLIHGGG